MLLGLLGVRPAHAIRPFVTDDARVVGGKLAQVETWLLADRFVVEHNILGAIGPTDWLEFTVGTIHGGVHSGPDRGYSITGPLLQLKELLLAMRDNRWPGIALTAGVIMPLGYGSFTPTGWGGFAYLALTESLLREWLMLHANLGVAFAEEEPADESPPMSRRRLRTLVTAGFGVQVRVIAGFHGVAEVYYGDPYDPRADFPAVQVGFRYIFNDQVQLDGTFGSTLTALETHEGHAQTEQWGTLGIRLVSPALW
ncbi:MAG: hypothetical protein RMK29_19835 [Myxococcales bacterium]|nr:hypothetical protein [Myxococcota bacterium]MDW8283960.1 hypothetical protein [Myxococcales bacterium]